MEPQVSVVIPVYNTSKYLNKCLQSVLNQKMENLEIIIVNDASTDDSLKIIEKFVGGDRRFSIIDKKINEGLEEARKAGIEVAKGKYLCHLDSDDWLPKNALRILLKYASENDADIVVGNAERVFDRFGMMKKVGFKFSGQPDIVNNDKFITEYYINFFGVNIFPVSMWGKLYKTSFVKKIKIHPLGFSLGEDLNYNIQIFPKADKIVFISEIVYCYRYGGMTSKFNNTLMPAAIRMYNIKQNIALGLASESHSKYAKIELKNFLKTFIEMLLKFKSHESQVEHKSQIAELVAKEEFVDLRNFYASQTLHGFELAFSEGDLESMYRFVSKEYQKIKVQYKIKRLLSKLFV